MPFAYEDEGSGVPLLLLHGLTFDRTTWRPIIERLGNDVRTVAVDLPGHGETGGAARSLWEVAADVHSLARELRIDRPIVVGHSMSGAIASIYGAWYPTLGVVNIDQPLDVRPFANLVRQLWPALNGPGFASTFQTFEQSMGLDNVPQPGRSQILEAQAVRPDVVLGYWDELRRADANQMQTRIEKELGQISCPYLAVSGRRLSSAERNHMAAHVRELQITEWPGSGHFVHLVDAERFAERLREFLAYCTSPGPAIM
jgi:pimeloyl-ACP methyl ester carboxylesterase